MITVYYNWANYWMKNKFQWTLRTSSYLLPSVKLFVFLLVLLTSYAFLKQTQAASTRHGCLYHDCSGAAQRCSGKTPTCQCREHGCDRWARDDPWKMAITAVFWPREFHGHMSLVVCSAWSLKRVEWDLATKQQLNCEYINFM